MEIKKKEGAALKVQKIIMCILVGIWLGVIFSMSAMPGLESNSKSKGVVTKIIHEKEPSASGSISDNDSNTPINKLNKIFRKFAHNFEYLILCILLLITISMFKSNLKWYYYFITIGICFLYACSDEFHQTFVAGRTGQFTDVLIDTLGASIGSLIFLGVTKLHKRLKEK